MRSIDQAVFEAINLFSRNTPFLNSFMSFVTNVGIPLLLAWIILFNGRGRTDDGIDKRKLLQRAIISLLAVTVIEVVIKLAYFHPRPFAEFPVIGIIERFNNGSSFPSGHAAKAFALALPLFLAYRKQRKTSIGLIALVVAALVALSRITIGVHWPSDVVAGIAIGVVVSYGVDRYLIRNGFIKKIKKRLKRGSKNIRNSSKKPGKT